MSGPLTPADVAGRLFRVRRRGYDADEVDTFLDEVESEIGRLLTEVDELRRAVSAGAGPWLPAYAAVVGTAHGLADTGHPGPNARPGLTTDQAQQMALRTLLAAHRAAELLLGEAGVEARYRVDEALRECEALLRQAQDRGEESDAAAARRTEQTLAQLEQIRQAFDARLAELRGYEAEYRAGLRGHLLEQLQALENLRAEPSSHPVHAP